MTGFRRSGALGLAGAVVGVSMCASGFAFAQDGQPIEIFPPIQSQQLPPPRPPQDIPMPGEEMEPLPSEESWPPMDQDWSIPGQPQQQQQQMPPPQPRSDPSIEEIVPEKQAEITRVTNPVAEFAGLDKITGRITSFDVYVNETVQFGSLQVTPKVCYSRPDAEAPQTDTFVEVDEITLDRKIRRIFTGWMFAESPGLNAVEHAVYDVWLKSCKQKSDVPAPKQTTSG